MKKKTLRKIKQQIRNFDLCSLVRVLENIGFKRKDLYFETNMNTSSARSLCEDIFFSEEHPRVRIVLNRGLLSPHSPMPSYFRKYMETETINSDRFFRFLSFFNHHTIEEHLRMALPERNRTLFPNWRETRLHYLSLLGFTSISTVWHLIKSSFPDLSVEVMKNTRMVRLQSSTLILGRDRLGPNSFIGERLEQTLSSFRVIFSTEEEVSELETPWPIEINRRLHDWIFPLLKKTDIHLCVELRIQHKTGHMHLKTGHYLGLERIGQSDHPFQLLLFYGFVKDLQKNRFLAQ